MRHASKLKWRPKVVKPLKLFPLKDLTGKQWRRGEKLSLFLRGERRVTARCSSRRICRDEEEHVHSSRGFWIFRRSALWIEPLRCLSKLAIADRRYSRVASSSMSTSVQAFSSRRICRDKEEHSSREGSGSSDALLFEPLRCLSKLAIADRRCSRGFFFDEYECAGY